MFKPNLFHTFPASCLDLIGPTTPKYIEVDTCLQNPQYHEFFKLRAPNTFTIMDCGVGASPKLSDPMGHVSKDPNWGAYYLGEMLVLRPSMMVVPDVLGDSEKTRANFLLYSGILKHFYVQVPQLMYVIQRHTYDEAAREVEFAAQQEEIDCMGFPRIVQYYLNDGEENLDSFRWADRRITFIQKLGKMPDKQVHMLGMSSLLELEFAAANNYSIDSRYASMMALAGYSVRDARPDGLNIDLIKPIDTKTQKQIKENMITLNKIYDNARS